MIALAVLVCWNSSADQRDFYHAFRQAPVGLVCTRAHSVEVRDFETGANLATFKRAGGAQSPPWDASLSKSGQELLLVGWGDNKLYAAWKVRLQAKGEQSVTAIHPPNFDYASHADYGSVALMASYHDGGKLVLFYDGPNVVKLNAKSFKVEGHWRLGHAIRAIGMIVYNMWGYSPHWNSLVAGQIEQPMEQASPPTFFIGKLGHPFKEIDGGLAGIVPLVKTDGWILLFANGACRSYSADASGGYAVSGKDFALGSEFQSLSGVYDRKSKCLFCRSADGRIASISFRNPKHPIASFADQPRKGVTGALSTFSGSRWLAEHVPQGPVEWFEKLPGGKLIYRFESKMKPGEDFLGIRD